MFPMISTLEELESAIGILEVKDDFASCRNTIQRRLDVGCVIEVPAAALMVEAIDRHLTFSV